MKTEEKKIWIEWGNTQQVKETFTSVEDFIKSGYLERYANNFTYSHLVKKEYERLERMEINNIYITEADSKLNYGLDFKMWMYYKADGCLFFKQIKLGGACITSAPLQRVKLQTKMPEGLDFSNLETMTQERAKEFSYNIDNKIIESFSFSQNVGYKKDAEFRPELRRLSRELNFIYY